MRPSSPSPSRSSSNPLAVVGEHPFCSFAESIPDLAWIADAEGSIYWYNQNWYRYTGSTLEQMLGWGWESVHDPDTLPVVLTNWQASIATGTIFDMVCLLKASDGRFRRFLTRITPVKDENGKVLRWFGTSTDISRELDAAAALRNSEARFRTATVAINAILWTNNAAGEMSGEQPAWSAFTGQTFEQYQGYGWARAVHPDDAQPSIDSWNRSVRDRSLYAFEHRVRRHDGVYRLCSIRALPVFDEAGNIREWVGVHTDITEERGLQRTLRETVTALRQQQELVDAAEIISQVGFWRFRPDISELFLSSGSRFVMGLPSEGEILIPEVLAHIHPDDRTIFQRQWEEALLTGNFCAEFRTVPSEDSPSRWILSVGRTVVAEGEQPYMVGTKLDITQQKRSTEALMRTEKLAISGKLAASIAHEINNPLEAVTNLLYLLLRSPLNEEQMQYATTLQSELERVSQIVTHTLRFHRQNTLPAPIHISDLVASILTLYQGRLHNFEVHVEQRLCATLTVLGLGGDLRQVLANLIGNAIDAMQSTNGTRKLYLRSCNATHPKTNAEGVRITVADRGTGIDAKSVSKIYEAFFTTKPETGTGLGLWVSMNIVNRHGGSLRVRSSPSFAHQGTVFQLFLPVSGSANHIGLNDVSTLPFR